MGFTFPENIALLALLLVCSPLAPDRLDIRASVLDLPVVHFVYRRVQALRARRAAATQPHRPERDPVAVVN